MGYEGYRPIILEYSEVMFSPVDHNMETSIILNLCGVNVYCLLIDNPYIRQAGMCRLPVTLLLFAEGEAVCRKPYCIVLTDSNVGVTFSLVDLFNFLVTIMPINKLNMFFCVPFHL